MGARNDRFDPTGEVSKWLQDLLPTRPPRLVPRHCHVHLKASPSDAAGKNAAQKANMTELATCLRALAAMLIFKAAPL
jgi:hypothetical protein